MTVTPEDFGAIGDGDSHPLSETYATLAAAQVIYPAAQSLDDEKDWCAIQRMLDVAYATTDIHPTYNETKGAFVLPGRYVVNRTVVSNLLTAEFKGLYPGCRFTYTSSVRYNGPGGTIDDPVAVFDFHVQDELGNVPAGRKGNAATAHAVGRLVFEDIVVDGAGGDMTGQDGGESLFVQGIRIRDAMLVTVAGCAFGGTLYDGIALTGVSLFVDLRKNFFHGIYRDAIAVHAQNTNFSTTHTIEQNEFGYVGRYMVLGDYSNSVDAAPRIVNNSFEGIRSNLFYPQHREHYVHGVQAGICLINAGGAVVRDNRSEVGADGPNGNDEDIWADLHVVDSPHITIDSGIFRNVFFTARPSANKRTNAAESYVTARGHFDITDQCNYHLETTNGSRGSQNVRIKGAATNLNKILVAAGVGLSSSNMHSFEDLTAAFWSVPVEDATAHEGQIVQHRAMAICELVRGPWNAVFKNCTIFNTDGIREIGVFNARTQTGDYRLRSGAALIAAWTPETAMGTGIAGLNYRCLRIPTGAAGRVYQAVVAGTTGTTEPTWPTTVGDTVTDGTVTWKCIAPVAWASENYVIELMQAGKRIRYAPHENGWLSDPAVGDRVVFTAPAAGGVTGRVRTSAGWKDEGAIAA